MADNSLLDIEDIVRDSFTDEDSSSLIEKISQLEPEEIALVLEAPGLICTPMIRLPP